MPAAARPTAQSQPGGSGNGTKASAAPASSVLPSESECVRAACDEVRALFRTPESLSRLPLYCSEYGVKREECRQELSQAIAQQIDDTRQAVQQLKQAVSTAQRTSRLVPAVLRAELTPTLSSFVCRCVRALQAVLISDVRGNFQSIDQYCKDVKVRRVPIRIANSPH